MVAGKGSGEGHGDWLDGLGDLMYIYEIIY